MGIKDPQQARIKPFLARGCHSGPLNFDQLLKHVFYTFGCNLVNFCLFGACKGPQPRCLIEDQFWHFCEKLIFNLQNRDQSQTCWKFGRKKCVYGFALYMAYLVPRNHFKKPKLMVFYWLFMGHIDNWSKNDFRHQKLRKMPRGTKKTPKNRKKLLQ